MKAVSPSDSFMARRSAAITQANDARINEVARLANDIQKAEGCSRSEALKRAEKLVPFPGGPGG